MMESIMRVLNFAGPDSLAVVLKKRGQCEKYFYGQSKKPSFNSKLKTQIAGFEG